MLKNYSVSVNFKMHILDDRLMDDSTFVGQIRSSIINSIRVVLNQQQGIGDIEAPNVEIWTER